MDLNLLATFAAVARTGSFTAAARARGLPKSSVSRGVARLEGELGLQLLVRTTRRVALTPAGQALHDRVAPLLGSMEAALGDLPEQQEAPSGQLRITAPVDVGILFLAEAVTRLTARHPAVTVELHLTGRVVDLVGEHFDAALRVSSKLTDSTLVVRRLAPITLRHYASPLYLARRGAPRTEADLAAHDRVLFRSGPERLRLRAGGGDAAAGHPRIVCDDLLFVRDALRAGAGIGMLPAFVAEPDLAAGALVQVLPRVERTAGHLHLVTPGARHVPPKVTAFRDVLLEVLRTRTGA